MLLENKTAVIYGAAGAIGGAVARAFTREGAKVFLAGRTHSPLDAVPGEIFAAGGGGCDTPDGCGERGELFVPRLRGARR
jgi:NAD(P)-dependent dehydrogenase (short-subunit alcohol dehydrogenase family)